MHRLRLNCSGRPALGLTPIAGSCPASCWDADDLEIQVWLGAMTKTNGVFDPFDLDQIQTLRLECRLTETTEDLLFAAKEVSSFSFCTFEEFKADLGQHAVFSLSNTDTNFGSGVTSVWISIVGELNDGTRHTFTAGEMAVVLSGDSTAIQPAPDPVEPYARYGFRNIIVAGQSTVVAETREDSLTLVAGSNITLTTNATTDTVTISSAGGSGSGDVAGPVSSTDNAIVRFDGTDGKLIKNSTATLSDAGALAVSSATIGGITAAVTGNANGYPDRLQGYVKCDEAGGITAGQAVYISGADGANDLAKLASAAGETTSSKTYGIATASIAYNAHGYITSNGTVTGLSVAAPNVTAGTAVWLSTTAGGLKFGAPYTAAEGHSVYLGTVRKTTGSGAGITVTEINVKVQNGYEIGELHNVTDSGSLAQAFLIRNATSNIWESKTTAETRTALSINNVDNTSDANKPVSSATQTALDLKANLASPTFTGTVSGITKSMVGLGNVDNTSDANKPISTATATALSGKADTVHTHTAGDIQSVSPQSLIGRANSGLTAGAAGFISVGTGLTLTESTSPDGTLGLSTTTVTAGSYNPASITVDVYGRITSASNGTVAIGNGGTGATSDIGAVTNLTNVSDNSNTSITLSASDSGKIIRTTSASAVTITLPSSDPNEGWSVMIIQGGAGQVTFSATGVTLHSLSSYTKISGQYGAATLIRVANLTYHIAGALSA